MTTQSTAFVSDKTRPLVRLGGLPRVEGLGPLGAVGELLRDQFGALRRWQREYGGVFELRVGPTSLVIAADANTASEMLIEGGQRFVRGGALYDPMIPLLGRTSMLTAEGEIWRSRRRAAQPQFRQRAIAAMSERVDQTLVEVLGRLTPGQHDLYHFSGNLSMAVALEVVFGSTLTTARFEELAPAIDYAIARIGIGWATHRLPRWIPIPGRRRLRRELGVIERCIADMVEQRLSADDYGDDFLAMLLHMVDAAELEPIQLRDEAVALVAAGYETTANTIGWALWELARQPDFAARVRAEADTALANGATHSPKMLAFTRRLFMETLRMYPSTIWLPRNAAEDTTLAGYPIAAGASVLCSTYLVHHDPHAWDEPERFDPSRFEEDSRQPRNRHAFMPFGLGQHMCIGQHLAMLEGTLAIARIAQRWDIAPVDGREPTASISTTMNAKDGIWLELSPRA